MKGVSVIVCCYNSVDRIGTTLQYLRQQETTNLFWEVLIVDNNCEDDTVNKAKAVWGNHPVKLKIVQAPKAGLIYAREAGIKSAIYDYLIFCDDDNWLDKKYVQTVYDLFEANPKTGAIGGQSTLAVHNTAVIPDWFKEEENAYAVGKQSLQTGDITARLYLWGAGLALRKHLAEKCFDVKFPFLLTGRKGKKITAGDDTEICNRIILMGYRLLYDERLKYAHFIPEARLTEDYLATMKKGFEQSYGALTLYSECIRSVVLDNHKKIAVLKTAIIQKPFNIKKVLRMLYWVYGMALYVNDDMMLIKGFYKKYGRH